jgi:cytochrome c oxidase assembly factor CtaG
VCAPDDRPGDRLLLAGRDGLTGPGYQETKVSDAAVTSGQHGEAAPRPRPAGRLWLAVAGVLAVAVSLVPPVATLAREYVFVESAQFVLFAMVAPALIVLGAPWRLLRLSRAGEGRPAGAAGGAAGEGQAGAGTPAGAGPFDRLAAGRQQHRSFLRAAGFLLWFFVICLVWRLPPMVDALARHPALVAAELVTLLAAGTGLWLELVASPPLEPRLPNPQRAAIAALAMWSTWAVAYALGFANHAVFHGYDAAGNGLSAVADQQITVGLVWAVSAFCFVPVVFVTMLTWLAGNDDPDEELQRLARNERQQAVVRGWERRPRGRRAPSP